MMGINGAYLSDTNIHVFLQRYDPIAICMIFLFLSLFMLWSSCIFFISSQKIKGRITRFALPIFQILQILCSHFYILGLRRSEGNGFLRWVSFAPLVLNILYSNLIFIYEYYYLYCLPIATQEEYYKFIIKIRIKALFLGSLVVMYIISSLAYVLVTLTISKIASGASNVFSTYTYVIYTAIYILQILISQVMLYSRDIYAKKHIREPTTHTNNLYATLNEDRFY